MKIWRERKHIKTEKALKFCCVCDKSVMIVTIAYPDTNGKYFCPECALDVLYALAENKEFGKRKRKSPIKSQKKKKK